MNVRFALFCAVAGLTSLSACEQPQQGSGAAAAARIGDEAISEAELNLAMSRLEAPDQQTALTLRGQMLDALIDQRLLSDAAQEARLDKDPEVMLKLAHAQRQVLSEAYMAQKLKDLQPPTDIEINDYYLAHPELFGHRRVYRLQALDLTLSQSRLNEVESRLRESPNLNAFSGWLKAQGIEHRAEQTVKPAEHIASSLLPALKDLDDGQVVVQGAGADKIRVVQLLASHPEPITPEQAHGAIERVLQSRARKARLTAELKNLRRHAKIEYVQGFSPVSVSPPVVVRRPNPSP